MCDPVPAFDLCRAQRRSFKSFMHCLNSGVPATWPMSRQLCSSATRRRSSPAHPVNDATASTSADTTTVGRSLGNIPELLLKALNDLTEQARPTRSSLPGTSRKVGAGDRKHGRSCMIQYPKMTSGSFRSVDPDQLRRSVLPSRFEDEISLLALAPRIESGQSFWSQHTAAARRCGCRLLLGDAAVGPAGTSASR